MQQMTGGGNGCRHATASSRTRGSFGTTMRTTRTRRYHLSVLSCHVLLFLNKKASTTAEGMRHLDIIGHGQVLGKTGQPGHFGAVHLDTATGWCPRHRL